MLHPAWLPSFLACVRAGGGVPIIQGAVETGD